VGLEEKVVVTCALTGVLTDPNKFHVPVTPQEMAAATSQAYNAGASIVHCHFRDQRDGMGALPTWDLNTVGDILEFECFETGIVRSVKLYWDNGMFSGDAHLSFVMGVDSGMPPRPELLPILKEELPPNAHWQVIATGPGREKIWDLHRRCLELEGNVRTGLEDTLYLPNGERATSNEQLVEALVKMVREVGKEAASPEEARKILGVMG